MKYENENLKKLEVCGDCAVLLIFSFFYLAAPNSTIHLHFANFEHSYLGVLVLPSKNEQICHFFDSMSA